MVLSPMSPAGRLHRPGHHHRLLAHLAPRLLGAIHVPRLLDLRPLRPLGALRPIAPGGGGVWLPDVPRVRELSPYEGHRADSPGPLHAGESKRGEKRAEESRGEQRRAEESRAEVCA